MDTPDSIWRAGSVTAEELGRRFPHGDVDFTSASSFHLIDIATEFYVLLLTDSIQIGNVSPGTLYILRSSDIKSSCGPPPHYIGLFETLNLAKELLLIVPKDVFILVVEAADCLTLGGAMGDAVKSAVELVRDLVAVLFHCGASSGMRRDADSGDGFRRAIATVTARWGAIRLVVI
jgi:Ni,Fe-hydrogenase maturation factor